MSHIRLRYSGLITFFARFLSLLTGFIFVTLITRNLSVVEFGQWSVLSSVLIYGSFPSILLSYWFVRYSARGFNIASAGVLVAGVFSIVGVFSYVIAGTFFLNQFEDLLPILLFASLQVPSSSIVNALTAIANGRRPEFTAYGFLTFESAKILFAFVIIYGGNFSLVEAILVIILAEFVHIAVLAYLIRSELKKKLEFTNVKKIIRSLWLPGYGYLADIIYMTDILIVVALTSSFIQIAIFKIAFVFSTLIEYGNFLAYPLYIKLLGGGKDLDVLISSKLMLMFTIPIAFGLFILAKPFLFLLNPEYAISEHILHILILYNLTITVSSLFDVIILGKEQIDFEKEIRVKQIMHSALFKIPTLNIIRMTTYVVGLVILTIITGVDENISGEFGIIWASLLLFTSIPMTIYKWRYAKKMVNSIFSLTATVKYVISASIMTIVLVYFVPFLTYNPKASIFAFEIFGIVGIGMLSYFAILLSIDYETRDLVKKLLGNLKIKF